MCFRFVAPLGGSSRCFRPAKRSVFGVKIAVFGARNGRLVRDPGPASQVSVRHGPRGHGKRVRTVRLLGSVGGGRTVNCPPVWCTHTERTAME